MPRSPTLYTLPPGTTPQNPGDVIQSAVWNAAMGDMAQTFNTVQPLLLGGTGAATAIGAFDAFHTRGTAIAAASTTNIAAATGDFVHITGNTTITQFDSSTPGTQRTLIFDGSPTLTFQVNRLNLIGAADIAVKPNDIAVFRCEGGINWRMVSFDRYASRPTVSGSNANGDYVKLPDGTMICSLAITVTNQAIATAYVSSFIGSRTWTFPQPFIAPPAIIPGQFRWGTSASWSTSPAADPTTTDVILRGMDLISRASGTSTSISAIAVGKWF